jgi:hypothetical protein
MLTCEPWWCALPDSGLTHMITARGPRTKTAHVGPEARGRRRLSPLIVSAAGAKYTGRMGLRIAFSLTCVLAIASFGLADNPPAATCSLSLELVESSSGNPLPGIVRITTEDGKTVQPDELVARGQGIDGEGPIHEWSVLPRATTIKVPAGPLVIQALSGLESDLFEHRVDLAGKREAESQIPLVRFARARSSGFVAGNTHLHLMKLSKQQADRYLKQVPLADGLDVVFISYLERAVADLDYTSNKYTPGDLARLAHGHVHFGHGEEHRHNFGSHGEGYGHILLLDIPYIVQPVSIGPGIMRAGSDSPPMQAGIDRARSAGGKVIWAHNLFGFEDIPNWITGRVDANNIFDGSHRGSFKDTYYRYLNIGLHVPFSTGTDWFIYDFSRAYVMADRPVTPTGWLDLLAAGKSYITNGPLLEFTVNDKPLASVIELDKPDEVAVRGRGIGRTDFKRIEVVQNGRVVARAATSAEEGHFVAQLDAKLSIDAPSWLALRTPPPPVKDDPLLREPVNKNEFGHEIFSHTSPIYVPLAGREVFDAEVAAGLLEEMKSDVREIEKQAKFANDAERRTVMHVYEEAIEKLSQRTADNK